MRVLLSTYACEPGIGSEPGVGWNIAREMAKHHEVWVITSDDKNRSAIEAELVDNPIPRCHFIYYSIPSWIRWWKREGWGYQVDYYFWQIGAYFATRKLNRQLRFDLAQHVTYCRYWMPSFIGGLLPVPFLWGPVGGGESAPRAFWRDFGVRGKLFEALRGLARWFGEHDPFLMLTARRSVMALATTEETAERMRLLGARRIKLFGESGLSKEEIDRFGSQSLPSNSPLRFISMGRLIHWKGFHLGLRAFAVANIADSEYWIVGDGPKREELKLLAKELGVEDKVHFWGFLPRSETLQKLGESHVLVHPSLHDSGGWVCLEAMAAGRPVLCLDLGGPTTQVTEDTGFKVSAHEPDQSVRDLAETMTLLAQDFELLVRMGEAGRKRVREVYSWERKGQFLARLYEEILESENKESLAYVASSERKISAGRGGV